jgi:two-component system, NtrC family, sensor kinase
LDKVAVSINDTLEIVHLLDQSYKFFNEFDRDSSFYFANLAIERSQQLYQSKEIQSNASYYKHVKGLLTQSYSVYAHLLLYSDRQAAMDTLESVLRNLEDTDLYEKGIIYKELGYNFRLSGMYEKSLDYSKKSLEFFKASGNQIDYMNQLIDVGLVLREKGDFGESVGYFIESLKLSRQLNDEEAIIESLLSLGFVYALVEKWEEAIKYQQEALEIFQKADDKLGIARVHNDMGVTFRKVGQYDSALVHHKAALAIRIDEKDNYGILSSYFYIGEIYGKQKNIPLAIKYVEESLIYSKNSLKTSVADNYVRLGDYYLMESNLDKAFESYSKSLKLSEENQNEEGKLIAHVKLASIAEKRGDYKESLKLLKLAESNAQIAGVRLRSNLYLAIATIYSKLGDYKNAYLNSLIHSDLKDSVLAVENLAKITKMTNIMTFENDLELKKENNEKVMAIKQTEIDREKITRNIFFTGMIVAIAIIGIMLFRFLEKKKMNDTLNETLKNLKDTQKQLVHSEKMASLGELTAGIAHEIQNPLNFVNNYSELSVELIDELSSELENGDIEEAKFLKENVKKNLEKIAHHGKRAEGIVKGMLQHSRSSTGIKEATDINVLCDEFLRLAYHGLRAKDKTFNASMDTNFDASLEKVEVVPQEIGRVILNLITNAFYAVNERKIKEGEGFEPRIIVSTKKDSDKILISVSDNGFGIPDSIKDKIFQPFFTTKPTGQGTGLGLSMSFDIVTKGHGGELILESKTGVGTTFTCVLPL